MGRAKEILQQINLPEDAASREIHGSRALFSEWNQDHAMAKARHETGREPGCRPLEINQPQQKSKKAPSRSRINERDIPF